MYIYTMGQNQQIVYNMGHTSRQVIPWVNKCEVFVSTIANTQCALIFLLTGIDLQRMTSSALTLSKCRPFLHQEIRVYFYCLQLFFQSLFMFGVLASVNLPYKQFISNWIVTSIQKLHLYTIITVTPCLIDRLLYCSENDRLIVSCGSAFVLKQIFVTYLLVKR